MQQQETHLQQMLVTLRTRLLVMCASTSIALEDAGTALIHKDVGRANAVIDGDEAIDALENDIDDKALSLLARAQPVAVICASWLVLCAWSWIWNGSATRPRTSQNEPCLCRICRAIPSWRT